MDTLKHTITAPMLLVTLIAGATRPMVQTLNHGHFAANELCNRNSHEVTVVDYLTGLKLSVTIERVDG